MGHKRTTWRMAAAMAATCALAGCDPREAAIRELALEPSELMLYVGKTAQLTPMTVPEGADTGSLKWTTSDPEVATVSDDGTVTGAAQGTATVTASAGDVGASCTVAVMTKGVESVELDRTQATVETGGTLRLTATVRPEDATDRHVQWSVSDPGTASVDRDGEVRGIRPGRTTVTARAGAMRATCSVTVVRPPEGVSLDPQSLQMYIGEKRAVAATVTPADATYEAVTWESSDPSVATVDRDGTVTAEGEGVAWITATCGKATARCRASVTMDDRGERVVYRGREGMRIDLGGRKYLIATRDEGALDERSAGVYRTCREAVERYAAGVEDYSAADTWRLPTREELAWLADGVMRSHDLGYSWSSSSPQGATLEAAPGKSLFLPATGFRAYVDGTAHSYGGHYSCWSSTPCKATGNHYLQAGARDVLVGYWNDPSTERSVRLVLALPEE